jgi:predicted metal-binding membrane protein
MDNTRLSTGAARKQPLIAGCVVLVTALAWAYLFRLDHDMSRMTMAMDMPWNLKDFFLTFFMWSVMMVGMMSASAAPVWMLFTQMGEARGDPRASTLGMLFGAGHLTVWIGFSAVAALLQWQLHENALLSSGIAITSTRTAGAILIAAGVYQLTPAKRACLTRCQSPLGFLMSNWRDGNKGALQLGLRHGLYCLGCCWALMCVLFVVGVMNLAWVAALTAFVLLEKLGAAGMRVARAGGVLLTGLGVVLLVR